MPACWRRRRSRRRTPTTPRAAYLRGRGHRGDGAAQSRTTPQIRSPIDGKTGPILIQPGNQVMAGAGSEQRRDRRAPSITLVVITQIQPVKISFSLPQADLPRIQARQLAQAR